MPAAFIFSIYLASGGTIRVPVYFFFSLLTGILILSGGFIYRTIRIYKRKYERKAATANQVNALKIQALNSAINSHFIYNVLSAIQYFVKSQQPEQAGTFLSYFARLMRITVDNSDRSFIRLGEELDRIRLYLELEQLRMNGKLSYRIIVEGFTDETVFIPNMLIMPFIENAILHGIIPAGRNGNIDVQVTVEEPMLQIVIEDDGIGIHKRRLGSTKEKNRSMGIRNVIRRLELFSDGDHLFEMTDRSEPDTAVSGTRIHITVPLKYMTPGEEPQPEEVYA